MQTDKQKKEQLHTQRSALRNLELAEVCISSIHNEVVHKKAMVYSSIGLAYAQLAQSYINNDK